MKMPLTAAQAERMMERWCATQDRSQEECRRKLMKAGIQGMEVEAIIASLIASGFVDEERFARAFVRGKMRMKGWGRMKIMAALRQHQVPDRLIQQAISMELLPESYSETIDKVAVKRWEQLQVYEPTVRKTRLIRYLMGKGFSMQEAMDAFARLRQQIE